MTATARRSITRQITAILGRVMQLPTDLLFQLLNGAAVQQMLDTGALITVSTILAERGGADLKDGYQSWAGRSIASCYRLDHGGRNPIRAWVRHRTTGRWIHPFVYAPGEPAIESGLRAYTRTAHLAQPAPALAA